MSAPWITSKPTLKCRVGIHQWDWDGEGNLRRCRHCLKVQKNVDGRWRTKTMYSACYCTWCGNELSSDPLTTCEMVTEYVFMYECRCFLTSTFEYGLAPCPIKVDDHG